jgi:hypothetical protein
MTLNRKHIVLCAGLILIASLTTAGCATSQVPDCALSDTRDLDRAIDSARDRLQSGCVAHFDTYMDELLVVAAGDPDPANKEAFSDFLVWASDAGLLSRRQSQETWNRYFNVKFVSLRGDYNNCAQTCPVRGQLMKDMETELADKERGMLQASLDREGYYRADQLFSETELVLEATCRACEAGGR